MSLLSIIILLVVVGVVLWAINQYVPMDQKIKTLLNIVVILFLVVYLLQATGALGSLGSVKL